MYKLLCNCQWTSASFHSSDPDQVVPFVLYTVPLYTHTHTLASTSASRSLFRLHKWHFRFNFTVCTSLLQLSKRFSLSISLINLQTFSLLHSFCWKLAIATTAFNFEHVISLLLLCLPFFTQFSTLGWHPTQLTFSYQVMLTLLVSFIFCVSHSDLHSNLLF